MSLLPYNPYFDGPLAPFPGVRSGYSWRYYSQYGGSPLAWHPFFHSPLLYHPLAMLRAAEQQHWHEHQQAMNPAIGPNGEFSYKYNALGYKPEELGVDIQGNEVVVSGQHHEKGGKRSPGSHHQFCRRFTLPYGANPESLKCDVDEAGNVEITGIADPSTHAIEYGNGSVGRRTPIPINREGRRQHAISY